MEYPRHVPILPQVARSFTLGLDPEVVGVSFTWSEVKPGMHCSVCLLWLHGMEEVEGSIPSSST
jgi:hypothetical protein